MTKELIQEKLKDETKYSKWYLDIIFKAKSEDRKKLKKDNPNYIYYENHHILPASIFPKYKLLKENIWNGVLLTAKEHFICHALIWKHYKKLNLSEQYSMAKAFNKIRFGDKKQKRYTSKLYELCKITYKDSDETRKRKARPGKLNGMYGKKQKQITCPLNSKNKYKQTILKVDESIGYIGKKKSIALRSSYEIKAVKLLKQLFRIKKIVGFSSEEVIIPYISSKDNKPHKYFMDFMIETKDNIVLIEVKPFKKTQKPILRKNSTEKQIRNYHREMQEWILNYDKWNSTVKYCEDYNFKNPKKKMLFKIWTEKELNI